MIFSELYGAYYRAVAQILRAACAHPVGREEMRAIVDRYAFGESVLNIEPALAEERWQLLRADGTTPIRHAPTMPLTTLEKMWVNAIALDPRIRLFCGEIPAYPGVRPLFTPDDVRVFDRYLDGDPYADEGYIRTFRTVLGAVKSGTPLVIESLTHRGRTLRRTIVPEYIEYSEKDDKFLLVGSGCAYGGTVNLARIVSCAAAEGAPPAGAEGRNPAPDRTVVLEVYGERNAPERVLMHFAHYEKQAEKAGADSYRVSIAYSSEDETEIAIRILSFGPMVKVLAPDSFVSLIKERLIRQRDCGL